MSKVIILGIDGLDPVLIIKWQEKLPYFRKLLEQNSDIAIASTFPPDSICAWISIFTGKTPAEHGLFESIDYLAGKKAALSKDRSTVFRGKTFWDIASLQRKKVCIINPFLAYPSWEVNGTMVSGPVFEGGETSAFPPILLEQFKFPPLGGMVDFPTEKELGSFIFKTTKATKDLAEVGLRLFEQQNPDLFFLTFLTLDRVKHFLWRFTDPDDPYYSPKSPYGLAIKDFYGLFDIIIGKFLNKLDKDTVLVVMSDHGHRRRCTHFLNLNEWLRQNGYIATSGKGMNRFIKTMTEKMKVFTVSALVKWDNEDWIYRIAKLMPNRKSLKKSTYLIDKEKSTVLLANVCGANPFGGVNLNIHEAAEYEQMRNDIIHKLLGINKIIGRDVILWAKKREDIYSGQFIDRLPDILFELDGNYGVGMDFYVPLVTLNYSHKKISGGHKTEASFLTYSTDDISDSMKPRTVIDIHKYILNLLGILD